MVAQKLGFSREWVYLHVRPGAIWPVARINGQIRVPASSLARFLESRTIAAPKESASQE